MGVVNRQEVDLAQLRHVLDQAEKPDYVIDKHVLVLGAAGDSGPLVHNPVGVVNRQELDLVLHQGLCHVLLVQEHKLDHVINNHALVLGADGDHGPLVHHPVGTTGGVREKGCAWEVVNAWETPFRLSGVFLSPVTLTVD